MSHDWQQRIRTLHAELVRRDDPTDWVREADAVEASVRYPGFSLRGPVFGVAAQDPAAGPEWRLLKPVVDGTPQMARDGLHSHLWFMAKDDTDDRAVRRELLSVVSVMEREPVDEVEALGIRYRVVRGDEFARSGERGLEPPRPTDPEPLDPSWEPRTPSSPSPDPGFVLDPDRAPGVMAYATQAGLREFTYRGNRFPSAMCADSERAAVTHPEVVLLPTTFGSVERGPGGVWRPAGGLHTSPHDARRALYAGMAEIWAMLYEYGEARKAVYGRAAEEYRARGRADEARVQDRVFRICRVERLMRIGPDGPEPPRPSDVDDYGPMKMHPTMDEDGVVHHEAEQDPRAGSGAAGEGR
ncbi:DUF5954 family protein [Streptomyces sp. NPDC052077]|uniref:DUF5954 family protein n=1 Tax=Streptomyces sp. NPDC052077 TaxID=3154757 RepID=UPI0034388F40